MLADLVREFCGAPENGYEVYENFTVHEQRDLGEFHVTTLGIIVKPDRNPFDVLAQLNSYMEAKGLDDASLAELCEELEAASMHPHGQDTVIYFPHMHGYEPPQP